MRSLALAVLLLAPGAAQAQDARASVRWVEPECVPAWWDRAGVLSAVRVELRGLALVEGEGIDIGLLPRACDGGATAVRAQVGARERWIDVGDTAVGARARVLALAIAGLLVEELYSAPEPAAATEPEHAPPEDAPLEFGARLGSPLEAVWARASDPPRRAEQPVSIALVAEGVWLPAASVALVGGRVSLALRPAAELPLALVLTLRGVGGSASVALGEVRASWVDAGLGAQVEGVLGPVRLGARVSVAGGVTVQEGAPADEGVVARTGLGPTVAIELAGCLEVRLAGPVALVGEVHGTGIVVGLDALAPTTPAIALRDLVPGARVGVALDL